MINSNPGRTAAAETEPSVSCASLTNVAFCFVCSRVISGKSLLCSGGLPR